MQHYKFLKVYKDHSLKFWISSSKNEGNNRFLVILKISKKNDPKKFFVYTFVLEAFYIYNISKVFLNSILTSF